MHSHRVLQAPRLRGTGDRSSARPMELTPISLIVPEDPLGIPGRNAKEAGRASSQMLPAGFPLPRLGMVFSQIQGSLLPFSPQASAWVLLGLRLDSQTPSGQGCGCRDPVGSSGQMDGLLFSLCWFPREGHSSGGSREGGASPGTYKDDGRRDKAPADLEEEGWRESQHHLDVLEIVPVPWRERCQQGWGVGETGPRRGHRSSGTYHRYT